MAIFLFEKTTSSNPGIFFNVSNSNLKQMPKNFLKKQFWFTFFANLALSNCYFIGCL